MNWNMNHRNVRNQINEVVVEDEKIIASPEDLLLRGNVERDVRVVSMWSELGLEEFEMVIK
jgi:hypothetical protein